MVNLRKQNERSTTIRVWGSRGVQREAGDSEVPTTEMQEARIGASKEQGPTMVTAWGGRGADNGDGALWSSRVAVMENLIIFYHLG